MKPITILTAPTAAGKNTIGHLYATQFCERGAVIDGDAVRWMLRQPHAAPWDEAEGLTQHQLGVKHSSMLARSFVAEGYEVVILDVLWADLAQRYRMELQDFPVRIVRLLPSWDEALRRLHGRAPTISDFEARWVYETQVALRDYDYSLDNSDLSAEQVAAWLAALA
jgi:hypothetical protein